MQIIITGGAGFLGQGLAKALLNSSIVFDELLLVDIVMPPDISTDKRVRCQQADLSEEGEAKKIISSKTGIVFHLAAVVSSHAEKDFDLGWKVNLDITRQLLEACRHSNPEIRFVFASSCAVFGGKLPDKVSENTVVTPQSSYGTQKAIGELLINDYTRKNFIDGRVLRLPTICVRPGRPNLAASSFVSSIIREPINGEEAVCPVSIDLPVLLASPDTTIHNIIKAATIDAAAFGDWRTVNLPGITVTVKEMINSLERITNKTTVERIQFNPDLAINKIVLTWPIAGDYTRALQMGFTIDNNFDEVITQFIANNKQ
jgi:nucleoside-diphosphate-sugar epimerase